MSDMSAQVRRALDVAVEAIGGSAREVRSKWPKR